jgi:hypothetical protein
VADPPGATATTPAPTIPGSGPLPAVPAGTTIDTLLTPNPGDNDPKYAHFGTLAVDRAHLPEFEQAQRYLAKNREAVSALYALTNAKNTHTVEFISDGNDRYNHNTNTLYWDPKSAMTNTDGSTQSAALGLLHEEDHLIEHQRDPKEYFAGIRDTSPAAYNNREEQRVIEGVENRAATILGEGIRHDHKGAPFNAIDPISRTPAPVQRSQNDLPSSLDDRLQAARASGAEDPPSPGADGAHPWDGKAHVGSFVSIDDNTVAQHVGRGQYQVYDVARDLGGVKPPEGVPGVAVDTHGHVAVPQNAEPPLER